MILSAKQTTASEILRLPLSFKKKTCFPFPILTASPKAAEYAIQPSDLCVCHADNNMTIHASQNKQQ